ncbi:2OG-Fe dioxygenase family protein [Glaciimonas immobilis]|nr:2OG-Fe dioxygenase family protein [Glaciimonas immobilis]
MIDLLVTLGATETGLLGLQRVSDQLAKDPTLSFRESRSGRFCIDFDRFRACRLDSQPFVLSVEEDFVRHDSGKARRFEEVGNDLQLNSAFQALLAFKSLMVRDVEITHRPKLDYSTNNWICTVFNLRTITTRHLRGEPALEGVHSDGVDHTMTTFLGSDNMANDSAITSVHDMREKNAISWDRTDPGLILGQSQHRSFLDTLLVVDHERKHSLSPVIAEDKTRRSTRDMLIFFTRKPVMPGHVSHPYDSLTEHTGLPMSIDLPTLAITG